MADTAGDDGSPDPGSENRAGENTAAPGEEDNESSAETDGETDGQTEQPASDPFAGLMPPAGEEPLAERLWLPDAGITPAIEQLLQPTAAAEVPGIEELQPVAADIPETVELRQPENTEETAIEERTPEDSESAEHPGRSGEPAGEEVLGASTENVAWLPEPAGIVLPDTGAAAVQAALPFAAEEGMPQADPQTIRSPEQPWYRGKAAVVGTAVAVTGGCLGGLAGVYAGLVYLFAMAEIDTICTDGRRKRLGKQVIRSEKGGRFVIAPAKELLERCETDRICIRMSALFVHFYRNRDLIVKMEGKSRATYVRREVCLNLFR